jgi:hypothetical protein
MEFLKSLDLYNFLLKKKKKTYGKRPRKSNLMCLVTESMIIWPGFEGGWNKWDIYIGTCSAAVKIRIPPRDDEYFFS